MAEGNVSAHFPTPEASIAFGTGGQHLNLPFPFRVFLRRPGGLVFDLFVVNGSEEFAVLLLEVGQDLDVPAEFVSGGGQARETRSSARPDKDKCGWTDAFGGKGVAR